MAKVRYRKLKDSYGLVICQVCMLPCCKHGLCINLDCKEYQVCRCEDDYDFARPLKQNAKTDAVKLS